MREAIAREFNKKFSTGKNSVSLDDFQKRNKLWTMQTTYLAGLKIFKATGNGNPPKSVLEEIVRAKCHFLTIVLHLSSTTISVPPEQPLTKQSNRHS